MNKNTHFWWKEELSGRKVLHRVVHSKKREPEIAWKNKSETNKKTKKHTHTHTQQQASNGRKGTASTQASNSKSNALFATKCIECSYMAEFTRCFHLSNIICFQAISFYRTTYCVCLSEFSRCTKNMIFSLSSVVATTVWIETMKCNEILAPISNQPLTPRNRKQHAFNVIWIKNTLTHVRSFPFKREKHNARSQTKSAHTLRHTYTNNNNHN